MKRKTALVWDVWNEKHIQKHGVLKKEVEEAYQNEFGRSDSYLFRQSIYGKTGKGRLITVVVSYAKQPRPYVISARVMSKKERRDYCEN
ncbi:MAG: hypothetical protein UV63_C0036G0007 [Microgenomates group bacterium GW2011_GWC1_43_11]|nr:MAG: hypothetical protein UV63_C0036G0007 [Microgenomates group bacterium GW2011_GWC1_43_11]